MARHFRPYCASLHGLTAVGELEGRVRPIDALTRAATAT